MLLDPTGKKDEPFNLLPNAKEAAAEKHTCACIFSRDPVRAFLIPTNLAGDCMAKSEKALRRYTIPLDDGCLGGDFETMRERVAAWVHESDRVRRWHFRLSALTNLTFLLSQEDLSKTEIIHQLPGQDLGPLGQTPKLASYTDST